MTRAAPGGIMIRIVTVPMALVVATVASAGVYNGNPIGGLQLRVELTGETLQTASVDLVGISLDHCAGGGQYVPVGQQLDAVQDVTIDVPDDDWCAATLHWGALALTGENAAGLFAVDSTDDASFVQLDGVGGETLDPFQVVQGQVAGVPLVIVTPGEAP